MTNVRASIFETDNDLDLAGFRPKAEPDPEAPPIEKVRAVSEQANFPSREAKSGVVRTDVTNPIVTDRDPSPRQQRRRRTGRNVQLSIKATPQTAETLAEISDHQGWVYGETLDRALAALKRELGIS